MDGVNLDSVQDNALGKEREEKRERERERERDQ